MAKLKVRVKPGANKNKVEKMADGTIKISVKEHAKKGKANKELISYLKDITGITVNIVKGRTSKDKLIEFYCKEADFIARLEEHL